MQETDTNMIHFTIGKRCIFSQINCQGTLSRITEITISRKQARLSLVRWDREFQTRDISQAYLPDAYSRRSYIHAHNFNLWAKHKTILVRQSWIIIIDQSRQNEQHNNPNSDGDG